MQTPSDESSASLSDTLTLATWNVPRSLAELRSFVSTREDALDVDDFEF